MSPGILHIEQDYPGLQYSAVFFAMSKVVDGKAVVQVNLASENAVAMLLRSIQWDVTAGEAITGPVTFTDNFGDPLLYQTNAGSYNEKNCFDYFIKKATSLNITADSPNVTFIVEYQFLTLPEKGFKKKL